MKFRTGNIVKITERFYPQLGGGEVGLLGVVADVMGEGVSVYIPTFGDTFSWLKESSLELIKDNIEIFEFLRKNNIDITIHFPPYNKDINKSFVEYFSKLIV